MEKDKLRLEAEEEAKQSIIKSPLGEALEDFESLESQLAEANDNYKLTCGQVDGLEEALTEFRAEVYRLRERSDLFQTTMTKYHKQLTQERQLSDELAEALKLFTIYKHYGHMIDEKCTNLCEDVDVAKEVVAKHKKRRGEG